MTKRAGPQKTESRRAKVPIRSASAREETTAAALVSSLAEAERIGTLARRLSVFCGPALLVIDEIGFLPLDAHQANLFFQVVSRRYEQGSIILTSNKSYGEWAEVFSGDAVIAAATLDRLLHHSTTISIKGESYRLKDKRRAGLIGREEVGAV